MAVFRVDSFELSTPPPFASETIYYFKNLAVIHKGYLSGIDLTKFKISNDLVTIQGPATVAIAAGNAGQLAIRILGATLFGCIGLLTAGAITGDLSASSKEEMSGKSAVIAFIALIAFGVLGFHLAGKLPGLTTNQITFHT